MPTTNITNYLVTDTETSNFRQRDNRKTLKQFIVQHAWGLFKPQRAFTDFESHNYSHLQRSISAGAERVHRISVEDLPNDIEMDRAHFERFLIAIERSDVLVIYNKKFDLPFLFDKATEVKMFNALQALLLNKPVFDPMLILTDIMKMPHLNKKKKYSGYKWPKQTEAYRYLMNKGFPDAHKAYGDVLALKDIVEAMDRNILIPSTYLIRRKMQA